MKLNVWKQAQELEIIILQLESRINDLESTIAAVLLNRKTDMISKERAEDFAERKARQRIKQAAYARKYYQKKKAERQEAK
jgi:hypothetical protein